MPRDDAPTESFRMSSHASFLDDGVQPLVDDHTWNDLDMDAVCARIDRTVSIPGRMALRRMLRSAVPSTETLTERDTLIAALAPAAESARALRGELTRLDGTAGAENLASLLWEHPPEGLPHGWAYRLLTLLAIASVVLALSVGGKAVFLPILVFALNTAIHFRIRVRWQVEMQALRFVGRLRSCAHRVTSIPEPLLGQHQRRLSAALHDTASVARRVALLSTGDIRGILYEYVNIFLLLELQAYQWLVRHWPPATPGLREVFLTVGELDALASVGQWRADSPTWCRPDFEPGSRAILDYLADHGLLVVAATHDLELTESLSDRYESYFFADDFSRDDLRFDYRLRPGVVTTRNAIRLLERLGYPKEIIARAREERR